MQTDARYWWEQFFTCFESNLPIPIRYNYRHFDVKQVAAKKLDYEEQPDRASSLQAPASALTSQRRGAMAKPTGRIRFESFDAINQTEEDDARLTTDGSFVLEHSGDESSRACEPGSRPQNEHTEHLSERENLLDQMYSYEREEGALI